jgi:hypothetical protein
MAPHGCAWRKKTASAEPEARQAQPTCRTPKIQTDGFPTAKRQPSGAGQTIAEGPRGDAAGGNRHGAEGPSTDYADFGGRDEERNGKASSRRSKRKAAKFCGRRKAGAAGRAPHGCAWRKKSGIEIPHSKNSSGWVPYRQSSIGNLQS